MSNERDMWQALALAEDAPDDMGSAEIVRLAAQQFGVDAGELTTHWIRKILACRRARASIGTSRERKS